MSHKGKTNTNTLIKGKNLFKGDVKPSPIEVYQDQEGNTHKRKVDHVRKGHVYHPTKGFRKIWENHQPLIMNGLLLQFGIVPN